jgi:hypothetical protein
MKWLADARAVDPKSFLPFDDASRIPPAVRNGSQTWMDRFLKAHARPYAPDAHARHSYRASKGESPDWLRHEYHAKGRELLVLESLNYVMIIVGDSPNEIKRDELVKTAESVAESILRMDGTSGLWRFEFVARHDDKWFLSSNPNLEIVRMRTWSDRADAVVERGKITFVLYKKIEQIKGFRDDRVWFDDSLRRGS